MTFETLNIFASGIAANLAVVVAEVTIEALRRFRPRKWWERASIRIQNRSNR